MSGSVNNSSSVPGSFFDTLVSSIRDKYKSELGLADNSLSMCRENVKTSLLRVIHLIKYEVQS